MRFDQRAATYDLHAAPQRLFARLLAGFIQAPATAGVLELGAGTGMLTGALAARGLAVHATDASPAMLALGRQAVPAARWSRLDAFAGKLPSSGLQVSSGLLQWAPDPVATLKAWSEALAAGGIMVHAFPCEPCLQEWRAVCPRAPIVWRDEAAWRAVFARAGLEVRRRELWIERLVFPSALAMARSMHASGITGPPVLTPGDLRGALREYERRFGGDQGTPATWAWLAIEASPSSKV